MISGAVVAFIWGKTELGTLFGLLDSALYEIIPGFLVSLVLAVVVSLATRAPSAEVLADFETASGEIDESREAQKAAKSGATA